MLLGNQVITHPSSLRLNRKRCNPKRLNKSRWNTRAVDSFAGIGDFVVDAIAPYSEERLVTRNLLIKITHALLYSSFLSPYFTPCFQSILRGKNNLNICKTSVSSFYISMHFIVSLVTLCLGVIVALGVDGAILHQKRRDVIFPLKSILHSGFWPASQRLVYYHMSHTASSKIDPIGFVRRKQSMQPKRPRCFLRVHEVEKMWWPGLSKLSFSTYLWYIDPGWLWADAWSAWFSIVIPVNNVPPVELQVQRI